MASNTYQESEELLPRAAGLMALPNKHLMLL